GYRVPTFIRTCADECGRCSDKVDNQGKTAGYASLTKKFLRTVASGAYSRTQQAREALIDPREECTMFQSMNNNWWWRNSNSLGRW
ncbi:hypothetical protein, partial [Parolsenella catena]|uniref:hypothetical protein n=1 Tax=Parolsenella catena TaxID=2003188 RepID=UPI00319D9CE6